MAERRCLSSEIVDSDAFLDMPLSAQALYFHLNMNADDDGFVNNSKKIVKIINAKQKDLDLLIDKRFLISFEDDGVVVIKHWWVHNTKRADRHKETKYTELLNQLETKDNGVYTIVATKWQPNGNQMAHKLKEIKLNENKLKEKNTKKRNFVPPTVEEVEEYCRQRGNGLNGKHIHDYYASSGWVDSKGEPVRNWKQKIIGVWERNSNPKPTYTDKLPEYDTSKNIPISDEEKAELLKLMGKEQDEQSIYNRQNN